MISTVESKWQVCVCVCVYTYSRLFYLFENVHNKKKLFPHVVIPGIIFDLGQGVGGGEV